MNGIYDMIIRPSDPAKIERMKTLLDEDATYFFEDSEGLHLMVTDNEQAHICDLVDLAGFDSTAYREKYGL